MVNEGAFQSLDADVQQAILDAAATAETRGWKMTVDVNADQVQFPKDNGMTIAEPTAEFRVERRLCKPSDDAPFGFISDLVVDREGGYAGK